MTTKQEKKSVAISDKKVMFTNEQIKLITKTVARGAKLEELQLFLYVANKVGLDPLAKQIHFVKRRTKQPNGSYDEQMAIQTGIDGFRAIAERSNTYAGNDDVVYNDETKKIPTKATSTVYRIVGGQRVPFTATARWAEFAPVGNKAFMWNRMPFHMLGKCAEALALRKAFPQDLSGIYVDEEMHRTDSEAIIINSIEEKKEEKKDEVSKPTEKSEPEPVIEHECHGCGNPLNKAVNDYSTKVYKKPLCRACQQLETK